jgi:Leucine-rich repeat (LRR) protein
MKKLEVLDVSGTPVSSLGPVLDKKKLRYLWASSNLATEVEKLRQSNRFINVTVTARSVLFCGRWYPIETEELSCGGLTPELVERSGDFKNFRKFRIGCKFDHLAKLKTMRELKIDGNCAGSLEPIGELTQLEVLHRTGLFLRDVAPLGNLTNLRELTVYIQYADDIGPLANLANLEVLKLYGTKKVKDITPLRHLTKLEVLELVEAYL